MAFMIGVAGHKKSPKVYLDWKDSETNGFFTFENWTAIIAEDLDKCQKIMLYRFDEKKKVNIFHGSFYSWQYVNKHIRKEV